MVQSVKTRIEFARGVLRHLNAVKPSHTLWPLASEDVSGRRRIRLRRGDHESRCVLKPFRDERCRMARAPFPMTLGGPAVVSLGVDGRAGHQNAEWRSGLATMTPLSSIRQNRAAQAGDSRRWISHTRLATKRCFGQSSIRPRSKAAFLGS